ncbi:MAG: hypothetical protein AAB455_02935 [Patescibacteria group bacterium]
MSSGLSTYLFYLIVFLVAAWVAYLADRRFGKNWYRSWYNLSHETKLPDHVVRGFVCGRTGRTQCTMAVLLSIVVTIVIAFFGEDGLLFRFFVGLSGVVVSLIGFLTGPFIANLWGRRDVVFTTIDRFEDGTISPTQSARKVGRQIRTRFSGIFGWADQFWNGSKDVNSPTTTEASTHTEVPLGGGLGGEVLSDVLDLGTEPAQVADSGPKTPTNLSPEEKMKQFVRS